MNITPSERLKLGNSKGRKQQLLEGIESVNGKWKPQATPSVNPVRPQTDWMQRVNPLKKLECVQLWQTMFNFSLKLNFQADSQIGLVEIGEKRRAKFKNNILCSPLARPQTKIFSNRYKNNWTWKYISLLNYIQICNF